jgi:hypothetical protein
MRALLSKPVWYVFPWLTLGLALLLAACGGVSARSAEQVHAAWLAALQANDREQALALFADTQFKELQVQPALNTVQNEMHRPVGPFGRGGPLLSVRAVRMEDRGAGKRGWSRWQYANEELCHITDLTLTPQGWRVVDFNLTTDPCAP